MSDLEQKRQELQRQRQGLFLKFREALGMTQKELAETMEYGSKQVIWQKENGRRDITTRDLLALEGLLRAAHKWPVPH